MSTPTSDGGHHVIPPDELKCVWMTAGILSYQLCDRQLDCEHCPLDQAMRMYTRRGSVPRIDPSAAQVPSTPVDRHLPDDRLYSREHCWLMRVADPAAGRAVWRVGLEPALASALLTPRAVVHTDPGAAILHGATHFWIVTEGGTFGVLAPVGGALHATNPALHDRPHLAATRPLDEGWLYEVTTDTGSKDLGRLMTAEKAAELYDAASARFHKTLRSAQRGSRSAKSDDEDDNATLRALADALGPARYLRLVRRTYG